MMSKCSSSESCLRVGSANWLGKQRFWLLGSLRGEKTTLLTVSFGHVLMPRANNSCRQSRRKNICFLKILVSIPCCNQYVAILESKCPPWTKFLPCVECVCLYIYSCHLTINISYIIGSFSAEYILILDLKSNSHENLKKLLGCIEDSTRTAFLVSIH